MIDVVKRIQTFNKGRFPDTLALKYKAMRTNVFAFYRGTCHLFYQDWPPNTPDTTLNHAPATWICGDLHLENFGSYKGDNRLVYFDMNDFDEAVLAPCTWEIARLLTSILVGAQTLNVDEAQALTLCHSFLESYTITLAKGHIRLLERTRATGMIRDLLIRLKQRDRKQFLDLHTHQSRKRGGKRTLIIDNHHNQAISKEEREKVIQYFHAWAKLQRDPNFYQVLDIAHRIAGTGSLGVERYVLLVEGKGSPDRNYLLDLKQSLPSALHPYLTLSQPKWHHEAERSITIQERMQGMPQARLASLEFNHKSYRLSELQPLQDRVALDQWGGKLRRLENLISNLGQIVAWAELRSSGRQGSAHADELIAFGHETSWHQPLLDYAQSYAKHVEADFAAFSTAYDAGKLK